MAKERHLDNAPITEAIIDFRVKTRAGMHAEDFLTLKEVLAAEFPKVVERRGFRFEMSMPAQEAGMKDLGLQGFFFQAADDKTIAQFRLDGFTLNRLRPYTSWERLFPQVMALWSQYYEIAQPESLSRLALRYLNRIELPATTTDFAQYLTKPPELPDEVPHKIRKFVSRITIEDSDSGMSAHVGQTLERDADLRLSTVLIDVDTFHEPRSTPSESEVRDLLQELHRFKNRIFFSLITEKTAGMYE